MGFINLWGAHIMCYEKEYIGEMITMEFIWSVYISIYIYIETWCKLGGMVAMESIMFVAFGPPTKRKASADQKCG